MKEQGFAHAVSACAAQAEVPYEELRRYAAPCGAIERVLAATPAAALWARSRAEERPGRTAG